MNRYTKNEVIDILKNDLKYDKKYMIFYNKDISNIEIELIKE